MKQNLHPTRPSLRPFLRLLVRQLRREASLILLGIWREVRLLGKEFLSAVLQAFGVL